MVTVPLVHLVLADHDFEYINRLAQWFMENKTDRFSVSVFTEKESFKNLFLQTEVKLTLFSRRKIL